MILKLNDIWIYQYIKIPATRYYMVVGNPLGSGLFTREIGFATAALMSSRLQHIEIIQQRCCSIQDIDFSQIREPQLVQDRYSPDDIRRIAQVKPGKKQIFINQIIIKTLPVLQILTQSRKAHLQSERISIDDCYYYSCQADQWTNGLSGYN